MPEMQIQITLTVSESKRIIAKGITKIPYVQKALKSEKIFLKGVPALTMLRGKVIAENGQFLEQRSMGKFLKRQLDPDILRYPCV